MSSRISTCILLLFFAATLLVVISCGNSTNDGFPGGLSTTYEFLFSRNTEDWFGDFADYETGRYMESYYELTFLYAQLPQYLGRDLYGLYISGNNHSADLFMFIKRRFDGFKPNTTYHMMFRVEFASDALEDSAGIGGGPGASVYLKAGATVVEPVPYIEDDFWRMNIDKGNQAAGGKDALVLGNIGIPEHEASAPYRLKVLENSNPFEVTTGDMGVLWVIIGTDSGVEGVTSLYYSSIKITFTEQKKITVPTASRTVLSGL